MKSGQMYLYTPKQYCNMTTNKFIIQIQSIDRTFLYGKAKIIKVINGKNTTYIEDDIIDIEAQNCHTIPEDPNDLIKNLL